MSFRVPSFGPAQMVLTIAVLLLGLFLYAMAQTAVQSVRLRQHERDLFTEVETARQRQAELQGLITYLESDEYIEAFARQQFHYVRPGEILVDVDAPRAPDVKRTPGERWWEAVFGVGDPQPGH